MPFAGMKFFKRSKNLFEDGATATATTGEVAVARALDKNPLTKWRSVGSSDATTETIVVSFPTTVTIDRILLVDHNFKSFTVKYDVSGVFTDFTSVIGLDGALGGGISESAFADDTAYYEFDSVSTSRIEIAVTTTQTVDAEKFISQIIGTEELGTLNGNPVVQGMEHSRNLRKRRVLSGKSLIQKSEESVKFNLSFKDYPVSNSIYRDDLDFAMTLFDIEDNFLVWLCGGKRGTSFSRYTLRGYRLKDIYEMQVSNEYSVSYRDSVYTNPANIKVNLVQAV